MNTPMDCCHGTKTLKFILGIICRVSGKKSIVFWVLENSISVLDISVVRTLLRVSGKKSIVFWILENSISVLDISVVRTLLRVSGKESIVFWILENSISVLYISVVRTLLDTLPISEHKCLIALHSFV